jgi:LmbE family N-acetylglucosaminyl deacetylase
MADAPAPEFNELRPKVALGIAAHPDDLDYGMAGTVAKWASQGCDVYYLVLTNGNKGSSDRTADPAQLAEIRRDEQRAAARILGIKDVFFYDYEDGMLEVTMELKRDIVRVIRQVRPEVVLAFDPSMLYDPARGFINHPDHRAAGQAAMDAVFPLARDHMSFPELLKDEQLEPHETATLLLLNFGNHNYTVDITEYIDTKMDALAAHVSQIPNVAATQEMMRDFANQTAAGSPPAYAEGYIRVDVRG